MARGTNYYIWRESGVKETSNEKLLLENYKRMNDFMYRNSEPTMRDLPAIVPLWWNREEYDGPSMGAQGKFHPFDKELDGLYIRLSDGVVLNRIACWGFNSTSLFMLEDIFDCGYTKGYIIPDALVSDFVEAVDLASNFRFLTMNKDARNTYLAQLAKKNEIVKYLCRVCMMPFPSAQGEYGDSEDMEACLCSVKDIFNAYLTLQSSLDDEDGVGKFVLGVSYWG